MTFEDCIRYIEKTPNGFLATVEGQNPHVRPMTVWLADESGIYFYTSAVKPVAAQLLANTNIEIAFHRPGTPPDIGTILRIAGRIELVDEQIRAIRACSEVVAVCVCDVEEIVGFFPGEG